MLEDVQARGREGATDVLENAGQATAGPELCGWPEVPVGRVVNAEVAPRRGLPDGRDGGGGAGAQAPAAAVLLNGVELLLGQHTAQLGEGDLWCLDEAVAVASFGAVLLKQALKGVEAAAAFDEAVDVYLSTNEVAHGALVVVKGSDHEEIHEWRAISAAVWGENVCQMLFGAVWSMGLDRDRRTS